MTLTKNLEKIDDGSLFKYVDWEKTKAYSLGFTSIYLNLEGREPQGIVDTKDKEALIDEITTRLENLKDNNKKVVRKAYRASEIYDGSQLSDSPDIVIGFNKGYRMSWQNAVGGVTKDIVFDNDKEWKGDHLVDHDLVPGVLFSNVKLDVKSASVLDIAPTVLSALGIHADDFDGKSLLENK